jgi:hypothetical protein
MKCSRRCDIMLSFEPYIYIYVHTKIQIYKYIYIYTYLN